MTTFSPVRERPTAEDNQVSLTDRKTFEANGTNRLQDVSRRLINLMKKLGCPTIDLNAETTNV